MGYGPLQLKVQIDNLGATGLKETNTNLFIYLM